MYSGSPHHTRAYSRDITACQTPPSLTWFINRTAVCRLTPFFHPSTAMLLPVSLLQVVDLLLPLSLLAGTAVASSHTGFHIKQHGTGYRYAAGTGNLKGDDINVTTTNDIAVGVLLSIFEVYADIEVSSIPLRSLSEANVKLYIPHIPPNGILINAISRVHCFAGHRFHRPLGQD